MGCSTSTLPNSGMYTPYDDDNNRDDFDIFQYDDYCKQDQLRPHDRRAGNDHVYQPQQRRSSFSCGGGGGGPLSSLNCANQTSIVDSPERCTLSSAKENYFSSSSCTVGAHQHCDDYLTAEEKEEKKQQSLQLQQLISTDTYHNLIQTHPSQPPFLGSMYWRPATPPRKSVHLKKTLVGSSFDEGEQRTQQQQQLLMTPQEDKHDNDDDQYYPSLITPSTVDENTPTHDGILHTPREGDEVYRDTDLWEQEEEKEEGLGSRQQGGGATKGAKMLTRKLFSEEVGGEASRNPSTSSFKASNTRSTAAIATPSPTSKLNCITPPPLTLDLTPPPPSALHNNNHHGCDSPNVTNFNGPGFQWSERHVTTLPSYKDPIRLRITERSSSYNFNSSPSTSFGDCSSRRSPGVVGDYYSYDPNFLNSSYYKITQNNGRPYGNGLQIKSCSGFMTLEDQSVNGNVLAVMKSIYAADAPRRIVYSPKQRFEGQLCSGFRLKSMGKSDLGKKQRVMVVEGKEGIKLYPWFMVKKESSELHSSCSVHYFVKENKGTSFQTSPSFIGRHGFDEDDEARTHTIVSRIDDAGCGDNNGSRSNKEGRRTSTPCCAIVRDATNIDAVEIVISPGIDPLLMIIFLAMQTQLDVEPFLCGFLQ